VQFDVHRNTNSSTKMRYPYLLDVQADLLSSLGTRVVVPLTLEKESKDMILTQLMPVFLIRGKKYVAVTPQMAGIARRELGDQIENLTEFRTEILAALDMLLTGV
jgi:toxin CcdB